MTKIPRLLRFLLLTIVIYLVAFSLLRLGFLWYFRDDATGIGTKEMLTALYLGVKFDMRLTLLLLLPVFLLSWIRWLSPFNNRSAKNFWIGYLSLTMAGSLLLYFLNFGWFAYLKTNMDRSALRFLGDIRDSAEMVWETYPVVTLTLLLVALVAGFAYVLHRLIKHCATQPTPDYRWKGKTVTAVLTFFLVLFGIYGKWGWYPLRWSDAFALPHNFSGQVAINPVIYFVDTLRAGGGVKVDVAKVRAHYDMISSYLGVDHPNKQTLNFERTATLAKPLGNKPNVVIVIMESFASYKSGLEGNPLDPTPYMDNLARNGYFFKNYYVPTPGTARSVFATVTGIPDVESNWTSTRNPRIIGQHVIANSYKGYDKYYFIGGSASWGNIRGLVGHNIHDVHIMEEGDYSSPRMDVWGISDLDLFREANKVFSKKTKPFFSIIQLAGNHRPYDIPSDDGGFKYEHPPLSELRKYGFHSEREFNSYHFMDYCVGQFIEMAKKAGYANNTIFAFYGDHGLPFFYQAENAPLADQKLGLVSNRVPFVIYSPLITQPKTFDEVAGEEDVMATLAGLSGQTYINTTLGRDLFDPRYGKERYAFTIVHSRHPLIGMVGNKFYFQMGTDGGDKHLYLLDSPNPKQDVSKQYPDVFAKMHDMTRAYYETAVYMLYHNKPLPEDK